MRRYVDCATLRPFSATCFRWRKRLNCFGRRSKKRSCSANNLLGSKIAFHKCELRQRSTRRYLHAHTNSGSPFWKYLVAYCHQVWLPIEYVPVFAICAMAGTLASSVEAPITAILLTAEMSGSLVHTLPVAACAFIGLLVSDILKIDPYMRHCFNVSSTETALLCLPIAEAK